MSAEEALKYGLIDAIVQPNDAKLRNLAMAPPGAIKAAAAASMHPLNVPDNKDKDKQSADHKVEEHRTSHLVPPIDADEYQFGKIVSGLLLFSCP
jgi:enoyl-CoA hydratase/carnithine racemase